MFEWTEESIRFRVDAAEQVGFDEAIAAHILPYLPENAHVCDAGCGLGYLSIALAAHCGAVTAVDTSGAALAVLRGNAERQGVENLRIRKADLFSMQPEEPYDAMVFCFFGQIRETLRAVRTQCSGRAILVKRDHVSRRFSLTERPARRLDFQAACDELAELGVLFSAETFPVEMGQPFRSLADAERFFTLFAAGEKPEPAQLRARLVETGKQAFPYYFPAERSLGLIVLETGDIPDFI
ncbi:MAG: methyltransferase [bacterium]|nr:methyltransferase [bacterium]